MDLLTGVEFAVRMAFASVPQIDTAELARMLQAAPADTVLVDVRSSEEFAVSHIPGARQFDGSAAAFKVPQSGTVVLYCSVGYRSSDMAQQLSRLHAQNNPSLRFVNLQGSVFRWALENRPLVDASGASVRVVHGFNRAWSHLLPSDRVVLPP